MNYDKRLRAFQMGNFGGTRGEGGEETGRAQHKGVGEGETDFGPSNTNRELKWTLGF